MSLNKRREAHLAEIDALLRRILGELTVGWRIADALWEAQSEIGKGLAEMTDGDLLRGLRRTVRRLEREQP